ncbi:MAG: TIGR04372 family glycosyltransferase [Candidatus Omnitrophica bacterium]|nr:TIGR04372 family glycosyltransferase [Candidatus Omnitrophota bacterium]
MEYLILLLRNCKRLRSAEYINTLWFISFGHQAVDLHMLAMRFRGKRLVVLMSDYDNFNRHLIHSFRGLVDIVFLKHSGLMHRLWRTGMVSVPTLQSLKHGVLVWVLQLLRSSAEIVNFYESLDGQIASGYVVEYIRLLHSEKAIEVKPPRQAVEEFRHFFEKAFPDLAGKWFVSLYLRKKQKGVVDVRDTHQPPYRKVIERIGALGGFVFCGGDADAQVFAGLENWLGYADIDCERSLIDLYFLSQCRFLISAASGTHAIASLFNVPVLITNCPFYWHSGWRDNQIIIFKKLRDRHSGRILPARETFSMPIVAYSDRTHISDAGLDVTDNTETEILQATEEMIGRYILGQETGQGEDLLLYDRFRELMPEESVGYHSPARPALSYLRSLEWG